jgi:hypothetical protein
MIQPGISHGKPAGAPYVQLCAELLCEVFGLPQRPNYWAIFPTQLF